MELTTVWFVLIAVFWIGYVALEGFDFGVGMLLPVLGRDDTERRVVINTIGPVWDGNEVWLLVAVGATFAAFPAWYATLLSGFYLPVLAILVALIVRGLAFEYRHQRDDASWRAWWDRALIVGSYTPALLWGVAFTNLARGVPIDADQHYTGGLLTLLDPIGLLGGLVLIGLCATHGAMYLALKTEGDLRARARRLSWRLGAVTTPPTVVLLALLQQHRGDAGSAVLLAAAALALIGGVLAAHTAREGWAFVGTFACLALTVAGLFAALFPDVMPSSTDAAYSLTTSNASATDYSLTVLTWAGAICAPVVMGYQAWTYWVFRRRIGTRHIPTAALAESR